MDKEKFVGLMSPNKKITAIIQARMSSTRLPGKVLINLKGKTVLQHIIQRIQNCQLIDQIIIATTDLPIDDAIVQECQKLNIDHIRGSSDNVLSRYHKAASQHQADIILRITSDCPLLDSNLLEAMLKRFLDTQPDYLSNTIKRTFPRGLDIEIMTFTTLKTAYQNAQKTYEQEHVTPYIYNNPQQFHIEHYTDITDNSNYRWTLDTPEDLELIQTVYNHFNTDQFTYDETLKLFQQNPQLAKINSHIEQKKLGQ